MLRVHSRRRRPQKGQRAAFSRRWEWSASTRSGQIRAAERPTLPCDYEQRLQSHPLGLPGSLTGQGDSRLPPLPHETHQTLEMVGRLRFGHFMPSPKCSWSAPRPLEVFGALGLSTQSMLNSVFTVSVLSAAGKETLGGIYSHSNLVPPLHVIPSMPTSLQSCAETAEHIPACLLISPHSP